MQRTRPWVAWILVVLMTASGAVVYGRLEHRWGPSLSMVEAGKQLRDVPKRVGTWNLSVAEPLPESARAMLECVGDVSCTYTDSRTRGSVGMTLIVGPAGPTSVHSPEVCFPSQNFRLLDERKRIVVRDEVGVSHEFWRVDFRSQDLEARTLHVYYGWSTGGSWSAPEGPRFQFAGVPFLYKLQVVGYVPADGPLVSEDPVLTFLRAFLPSAKGCFVNNTATR